jgi:hypothetical protein
VVYQPRAVESNLHSAPARTGFIALHVSLQTIRKSECLVVVTNRRRPVVAARSVEEHSGMRSGGDS